MPADGTTATASALARTLDVLTGVGEDSLAPDAWAAWWENALAPNAPPAKIQPRIVLDARGVSVVNIIEGLQPIPWIGPVAWSTIPDARHPDGAVTPAHLITPAEALEILATRGVWPWEVGADGAPRWWCSPPAARSPGDRYRDCLTCDDVGHTDAPPSLPALVSAAACVGLREAVELAREAVARLRPWGVAPMERCVLRVGAVRQRHAVDGWPDETDALVTVVRYFEWHDANGSVDLSATSDAVDLPPDLWWRAHAEVWPDVSNRPCPHAPVLSLLRMGFALDRIADGTVTLVCPAVGAP